MLFRSVTGHDDEINKENNVVECGELLHQVETEKGQVEKSGVKDKYLVSDKSKKYRNLYKGRPAIYCRGFGIFERYYFGEAATQVRHCVSDRNRASAFGITGGFGIFKRYSFDG